MRGARLALAFGAALAISACGHQEQSSGLAPSRAPAPAQAPAVNAAPVVTKDKPAEAQKPPTQTRLNEDGSETVEETTGDSGARNPLLAAVASTVSAATQSAGAAESVAAPWQEGVNYIRLVPAQPTAVAAGQVEVLEFFWYACPHCYAIEPQVTAWLKTKPAYITFTPVPTLWNEGHRSLARLFYTLDVMGKSAQFHDDIFRAIQVNGDPLAATDSSSAAAAERAQVALIKKLGLSEADFEKYYHGFDVDQKLQRADELATRYRVSGVPTFVINGKYITDIAMAGGPDKMLPLLTALTAMEHKH